MTILPLSITARSPCRWLLLLSLGLCLQGQSQWTNAGGFQLSDHSITALGRSQAGYGIVGDDASAIHFNPAGMTLLNRRQIQSGGAFIQGKGRFTNIASTDENTGANADGSQQSITPNGYIVWPMGERWRWGLGLTVPFGSSTDYPDNFIGRYDALETKMITVDLNPSLAYKINDTVSVGFGVSYQTLDVTLGAAATPAVDGSTLVIKGDSQQWGYNAGIMFSFDNDSRLGLGYRSKVDHDIEGTATFANLSTAADGSFAATSTFTSPETAYLAYHAPLSSSWDVSLGYRWTRWSRYQQTNIAFPDGVASQRLGIEAQWSDVQTIAVGVDYHWNSRWTLRTGAAFDETPVPDTTRSVRTVDADRTWLSIGASFRQTPNLQWDVAYRYITFANAPVNRELSRQGSSIGTLSGEFKDIHIHTLALQMNYRFD